MTPEDLSRHDLVSVRPGGPDPLPAGVPTRAMAAWEAAGRPLIVRRGAAEGGLPLGLPLPPSMGKARIALTLPVHRVAPRVAPGLAEVAGHAPLDWREILNSATTLGRRHGLRVRPYGALLWEALLGLRYLHSGSDLDLLWTASGPVDVAFLDDLSRLDARSSVRLDGEVVVDGYGVQWRELSAVRAGEDVLCRSRTGVELRPADGFFASCPA